MADLDARNPAADGLSPAPVAAALVSAKSRATRGGDRLADFRPA